MALENYDEMRDSVRDPKFLLQKELSLRLEQRFPEQFIPRYSMVMFHQGIPYTLALERGRISRKSSTSSPSGRATSTRSTGRWRRSWWKQDCRLSRLPKPFTWR
jgi:hypothetical protein